MDSRPTLLIVDDAPTNIAVLNSLLKEDYRILVATSGPKALELATGERPPNLILLDVVMPEMDGFSVCLALKSNPSTRDIPVLLVTSHSDAQQDERGIQAGACDLIPKPVSPALLRARIQTHLKLAELLRSDSLNS